MLDFPANAILFFKQKTGFGRQIVFSWDAYRIYTMHVCGCGCLYVQRFVHHRDLTCRINFRTFWLNLLFVTSICSVFFPFEHIRPLIRQFYVLFFHFFLLNTFYHDMCVVKFVNAMSNICISLRFFFSRTLSFLRRFVAEIYKHIHSYMHISFPALGFVNNKILLQLVQGINSSRFDF